MAEQTHTLEAILTATENITDVLEEIEGGLRGLTDDSISASEALDQISEATQKLNAHARATARGLDKEGDAAEGLSAAMEAAKVAKEAVTVENEQLYAAAKATVGAIDKETRAIMSLAGGASTATELVANLAVTFDLTEEQADELAKSLNGVALAEAGVMPETAALDQIMRAFQETVDDTEDEVRDLSGSLEGLGAGALAASFNLGPFNFALENLFTNLAQLIPITGALGSAFMALGSAALFAGAAIGAIFGGGALVMASSIASTSEDIKGTMQGLQKVMEKVAKLFKRAFAPLQNQKSLVMFQNFIAEIASVINFVAKAIANMQEQFRAFGNAINKAFWASFPELIHQLSLVFLELQDELVTVFQWLMKKIPNALAFFRNEGEKMLNALGGFVSVIIDLFREFTRVGVDALSGILPVLAGILKMMAGLVELINAFPDKLVALVAGFVVLTKAMDSMVGIGATVARNMSRMGGAMAAANGPLASTYTLLTKMGAANLSQAFATLAQKMGLLPLLAANVHTSIQDDLIAQFDSLDDSFEDTDQNLTDFSTRLKNFATGPAKKGLIDFKETLVGGVGSGLTRIGDKVNDFKSMAHSAFTSIPPFKPMADMSDIRNVGLGRMMGQNDGEMVMKSRAEIDGFEAANRRMKRFKNNSKRFVKSIPGRISDGFKRMGAAAKQLAANGLTAVSEGAQTLGSKGLSGLARGLEGIEGGIKGLNGRLTMLGGTIQAANQELDPMQEDPNFTPLADGIEGVKNKFKSFGKYLSGGYSKAVKGIKSNMLGLIGVDMTEFGLKDMKTGKFTTVMNSMNNRALEVSQSLNDALMPGINSLNDKANSFADTLNSKMLPHMGSLDDMTTGIRNRFLGAAADMKQWKYEMIDSGGAMEMVRQKMLGAAVDTKNWIRAKKEAIATTVGELNVYGKLKKALKGNFISQAVVGYYRLVKGKLANIYTTYQEVGALGSLKLAMLSVGGAITGVISSLWGMVFAETTTVAMTTALSSALGSVARMGIPVISTLAQLMLMFISLATTEGIATAATMTLSAALSTIGWTQIVVALTAIIGLGAILAGVLGNMGAASSGLGQAFNLLKKGLVTLFGYWMSVGTSVWNMTIEFLEMILSPLFALWDGFKMIAQAMGLMSKQGSAAGGMLDVLVAGFDAIVAATMWVYNMFAGLFDFVGDIVYAAIITPFKMVAWVLNLVTDMLGVVWSAFMDLAVVQQVIGAIMDAVAILTGAWESFVDTVMGVFDAIMKGFTGFINSIISDINTIIKGLNSVPGVSVPTMQKIGGGGKGGNSQLTGAKTSAKKVKGNAEKVGKKAGKMMTGGKKTVNNNVTKNEYNFGDFTMLPEEKARVKGLVKDALKQANRNKRLEGGHIG